MIILARLNTGHTYKWSEGSRPAARWKRMKYVNGIQGYGSVGIQRSKNFGIKKRKKGCRRSDRGRLGLHRNTFRYTRTMKLGYQKGHREKKRIIKKEARDGDRSKETRGRG